MSNEKKKEARFFYNVLDTYKLFMIWEQITLNYFLEKFELVPSF